MNQSSHNFLHEHQGLQRSSGLSEIHVIVDRADWEEARRHFNEQSQIASVNEGRLYREIPRYSTGRVIMFDSNNNNIGEFSSFAEATQHLQQELTDNELTDDITIQQVNGNIILCSICGEPSGTSAHTNANFKEEKKEFKEEKKEIKNIKYKFIAKD